MLLLKKHKNKQTRHREPCHRRWQGEAISKRDCGACSEPVLRLLHPDFVGVRNDRRGISFGPPRNDMGRGFMLLEVILSILVIASGLAIVMRSYSTSLKGAEYAMVLTKACFLLEDELFEWDVKGFKEGLESTESSGGFEGEEHYGWSLKAGPLDDKETIKMNKVDLSVVYKKENQPQARRVSISTFLKYKEGT